MQQKCRSSLGEFQPLLTIAKAGSTIIIWADQKNTASFLYEMPGALPRAECSCGSSMTRHEAGLRSPAGPGILAALVVATLGMASCSTTSSLLSDAGAEVNTPALALVAQRGNVKFCEKSCSISALLSTVPQHNARPRTGAQYLYTDWLPCL